jgi:hypothetical protein
MRGGNQVTQDTSSANANLTAIHAINAPQAEGAIQALNNEAVEYSDLATKSVFFPVMLDSFWSGFPRRARLIDSNWVGWGSNPQPTP